MRVSFFSSVSELFFFFYRRIVASVIVADFFGDWACPLEAFFLS